jgi:hypothetical protein
MKKSIMILLIFLELIISGKSYNVENDNFIFQVKCEDKKAKTGECYYSIYDSKKKSHEYAIFDKCGKGKYCSDDRICVKYPEKIKNGKSCNYDEDCSSGSCINQKCGGAKEGEKCDSINCEAGLICYPDSNSVSKCVKPAKEGTKPENTECMGGLIEDNDGKCAKYGILDDGSELKGDRELCKSGFAHMDKNFKFICDSIDTEPICEKEFLLKTKGRWKEGTEMGENSDCVKQTDYNGVDKVYYRYSKLQSSLYGEFLEAYKELDLDKINSEGSNWLSGKVREKYYLYEKAPALEAAGIINSQGKVVDDKKCEYDFMIKHLHSSFIKLKAIIIAMVALLF